MNTRILTIIIVIVTAVLSTWLLTDQLLAKAPPPSLAPLYSTYLGDTLPDIGESIVVDNAGNMVVVGRTESPTFPLRSLAAPMHGIDVFVARFLADGSLDYLFWFNAVSTFDTDSGWGVATDDEGGVYVTGETRSPDFCTVFGSVPGYDTKYKGSGDAFVLKVKPDGSGLAYCTFLGGDDMDIGRAIVVNDAHEVYVTGGTWSTDFPMTPTAFEKSNQGERDVFVAKLDATGTALEYATYLGGTGSEEARAVVIDTTNNAYVTGWTRSTDLYTETAVYDPTFNGGVFDVFLMKLNPSGSELLYSTYIGGQDEDQGMGMAVDENGRVYLTGYTKSTDFPTTAGTIAPAFLGVRDAFVLRMDAAGAAMEYATYLGGAGYDHGFGIDIAADETAVVVGETWSADFPTTDTAYQPDLSGERDAFVAQVSAQGNLLWYATYLGGTESESGYAITGNGQDEVYVTGQTNSADFPITPSAYDTEHNGDYDVFVTQLPLPGQYHTYLPLVVRP